MSRYKYGPGAKIMGLSNGTVFVMDSISDAIGNWEKEVEDATAWFKGDKEFKDIYEDVVEAMDRLEELDMYFRRLHKHLRKEAKNAGIDRKDPNDPTRAIWG